MKVLNLKKISYFAVIMTILLCIGATLSFAVSSPGKVDSLKAKSGSASTVTLSWDKVKDCDAYAVFYYNPKTDKYTFIKNTKDTEYKVTGLDEGKTYYFAIQGYNNDGDQKLYGTVSDYAKATTKIEVPDKVKNLEAPNVYSTKLKLTWNAVKDAKYSVYLYNADTKKYTHLDNTSKESFTVTDLKPETTYRFAVRAYKKVGDKTYYGDYSSVLKVATNPMPLEVEDARKLFNKAIDVYMNWIYSCSYTASGGYIYREFYGVSSKFAPVNHPDIKTKADLEKMLSKYFTESIYENELYLYIEVGGKLYHYAEGSSGDPDKGTKYYTDSIKKITYKKYKYTLSPVYYLEFENKYSPDSYTFTIVRKDGNWVFDGNFYTCQAKIKD